MQLFANVHTAVTNPNTNEYFRF
jgi:hypothetical protein